MWMMKIYILTPIMWMMKNKLFYILTSRDHLFGIGWHFDLFLILICICILNLDTCLEFADILYFVKNRENLSPEANTLWLEFEAKTTKEEIWRKFFEQISPLFAIYKTSALGFQIFQSSKLGLTPCQTPTLEPMQIFVSNSRTLMLSFLNLRISNCAVRKRYR